MSYLDGRAPLTVITTRGTEVLDKALYDTKRKAWVGTYGPGSQKPLIEKNLTYDTVPQVQEQTRTATREGSFPNNLIGNFPGFNKDLTLHRTPIQSHITGRNAEYNLNPFTGYGGTYIGSQYMYGGLSNAFDFINGKYTPKVLHQHSSQTDGRRGARLDSLAGQGYILPLRDKPWYNFGPY